MSSSHEKSISRGGLSSFTPHWCCLAGCGNGASFLSLNNAFYSRGSGRRGLQRLWWRKKKRWEEVSRHNLASGAAFIHAYLEACISTKTFCSAKTSAGEVLYTSHTINGLTKHPHLTRHFFLSQQPFIWRLSFGDRFLQLHMSEHNDNSSWNMHVNNKGAST